MKNSFIFGSMDFSIQVNDREPQLIWHIDVQSREDKENLIKNCSAVWKWLTLNLTGNLTYVSLLKLNMNSE